MTEEPLISPVSERDIPSIMTIQEKCLLSPWANNSYRKVLKDPDFMLYKAETQNAAIAFIAARLITSEFSCELLNIGVLPNQQRKTIGGVYFYDFFR